MAELQWLKPLIKHSFSSGLKSLCENSESARFCSARLLSGHSSYRHDPQCPLERRALQNCASLKFSHRLSGTWVVQPIAFPRLPPGATMYRAYGAVRGVKFGLGPNRVLTQ